MKQSTTIAPALATTLALLANALLDTHDDWWVIGSAAMALHGADVAPIADVDVLVSEGDALLLLDRFQLAPITQSGTERFRSAIFARWTVPPLMVEIMAGFEARSRDGWQRVEPSSRELVLLGSQRIPVPSIEELIALCTLFGRPKDQAREQALRLIST